MERDSGSSSLQFPTLNEPVMSDVAPADGQPLVQILPQLSMKLTELAMEGPVFPTLSVNSHMVVATLTGEQLEPVVYNPNKVEDEKAHAYDRRLREAAPLRAEVQRLFEKSKKDNAVRYSAYIEEVELHGRYGFTPAINLWTPESLSTIHVGVGTVGFTGIPRTIPTLIPFEGETQLAGRFQAWERNPGLMNVPLHVTLVHGRPAEWAQQAFHDVNVFGIKPNAALAIAMDRYDTATMIAKELEKQVPFLTGKVNTVRRQLRTRDRKKGEIMTITTLRTSVATISKGIAGVAFGTRTVPIDETEREKVHRNAVVWWRALGEHLGKELADPDSVATSPAVVAALGAVGHDVLSNGGDPQAAAAKLASEVKWAKGNRWVGVAGKLTDKGAFSVGGAKEYAYLIHKALTDPTTEGYAKIRA